MNRLGLVLLGSLGAAAFAAGPVAGEGSSLAMLEKLDRGEWRMRYRGEDEGIERICLSSGRDLIQLRHQNDRCRRVIVDDDPSQVTVQYTCPGKGYGRTHIRRESSQLVQIDSQGIENGLPFSFAAEARRVGVCRS